MSRLQPLHFHPQAGWGFHNPTKLTVGRGCRQALAEKLTGQTLLIVTTQRGRRQLIEDVLLRPMVARNRVIWVDGVRQNPGLTDLQAEIERLQGEPFDSVVAFGGGSAMDAAKTLNVALAPECREHDLRTLLADPGRHAGAQPRPLYTVPTTAGTGSEVTPFATVWHHEIKKKFSLAGSAVWPTEAIVDSALTDSVPLVTTISTGLDAINQAAESLWNKNANPITLSYSTRALCLGFATLPLLATGENTEGARDQMIEASLLAGLAISRTRTALCHSISYPITAHFGVPHGLACAFTMPAVLRQNLQAEDGRFAYAAQALTGCSNLDGFVACFDYLHELLQVRERVEEKVPNLGELLSLEAEMLARGRAANNLAGPTNLRRILEAAW